MASVFANPAIVALMAGVPSLLLGYLGYRRSQQADKIAEQAGIATVESGTIAQAIDVLNQIIDNLQADNAILREDRPALEECRRQLADLTSRLPRPPVPG